MVVVVRDDLLLRFEVLEVATGENLASQLVQVVAGMEVVVLKTVVKHSVVWVAVHHPAVWVAVVQHSVA